jgi:uncharacterized membrane protein
MVGPKSNFSKFCLYPIRHGFLGFVIFLAVLLSTKLFAMTFGIHKYSILETEDLLLSIIGFVTFFLIRLLENFTNQKS